MNNTSSKNQNISEDKNATLNYIHINHKNKIEEYTETERITEIMNFVNSMSESEDIGIEINKFFQSVIPNNKEGDVLKVNISIANKSPKLDKRFLERSLDEIMNRSECQILILTKKISERISTILKRIFLKIKKSKFKSQTQIIEESKKIVNRLDFMDILNKYKNYKPVKLFDFVDEREAFYKFEKFPEDKKYDLPIEMLILIRKFILVKKLKLTLGVNGGSNEQEDVFDKDDLLNIIYILLNYDWLFQSIVEIEVDLRNSNLIDDQINLCRENLKSFSYLFKKDIKITVFKAKGFKDRNYQPHLYSNFNQKNLENCEINNNYNLQVNKNLNSLNENITSNIKQDLMQNFINKYTPTLEMIIIYAYFISKMSNILQCCFILPINLEYEIISMLKLKEVYLTNFHFLSFLTNTNISNTTIDFNSLDNLTFEKVLNFLNQNQSMVTCRLSFFPPEEYLKPELLYKILQDCDSNYRYIESGDSINKNPNSYLFFDPKPNEDIDNYMLRKLSEYFEKNITKFLYLLTIKTSISELSLIFDIPTILNKNDYFNTILLKFFLNLFIYIDKNQNSLNTLSIVAENFIFDNRKFPILNDFCDKLFFYMDENNKLTNLTFQVRFFDLINIYRLIPYNICYLSLGSFDYQTFISFVEYITSSEFSIHSKLKKLKINLNNTIVDLNDVFEPILRLLTEYPKNLKEINIYTFLTVNYEQIEKILKCTDFNTLENIFIQFYKGSISKNDELQKLEKCINGVNGVVKKENFLELYYIERNVIIMNMLLKIMAFCSKINKNFMDYNIYLNIEKFLSRKKKKTNIIQFK